MYGTLIPSGGGDDIPLKKKELILGRKEDCDIVLRFNNVSGRHCRLILSDGYWYVVDMNSTNGVKVNGAKVLDRLIGPGSRLTIATHEYSLQYNPEANGARGTLPPDMLENDIFSKSLLERSGLTKGSKKTESSKYEKPGKKKTFHEIDFSQYSADDVEFS